MSTTSRLITAEELCALSAEGQQYELIEGVLRPMSPTGEAHGVTIVNIAINLAQYVKANGLGIVVTGEPGYILARDPDTVRCPDIAFVAANRVQQILPGYRLGPPDLAVEVVSPSDRHSELQKKVYEWLDAGCRMVVTVDPALLSVTVYTSRTEVTGLQPGDHLEGGDVVPGWQMPVAEIFS